MVHVTVTTPLRPTEDPDKVQAAATAFWPEAEVALTDDGVRATATDLDVFRQRVWELRIIDAVRGRILPGCDGPRLRFRLGKQAALGRHVAFPTGPRPHPLGDLDVEVTVEDGDPWPDAEGLVWWLCPETRDGEIVGAAAQDA